MQRGYDERPVQGNLLTAFASFAAVVAMAVTVALLLIGGDAP